MSAKRANSSEDSCFFAWAGISFRLPAKWQLSNYSFSRRGTTVKFDDDYATRLEVEWIRLKRGGANVSKIHDRYNKAAGKLTAAALRSREIKSMPLGWTAFVYDLPDGVKLVTAFALIGSPDTFCFMQIYFSKADAESPVAVTQLITSRFETHFEGMTPWSFYDVSFELPADFSLLSTSLQAGNKLLIFQWKQRRLYLWHFSLADVLLKQRALDEWVAEFLNTYRGIKGRKFGLGYDGRIEARRTWRYRWAHHEEIARWCFRCRIGWRHEPAKNQIRLAVFSYRREADLARLDDDVLPRLEGDCDGTAESVWGR